MKFQEVPTGDGRQDSDRGEFKGKLNTRWTFGFNRTQTVPARKLVWRRTPRKLGRNVAKFSSEKRARQFAAKLQ